MRLANETRWDAGLLRSELPSGRMMASLVVRLAYFVDDAGRPHLLAPDAAGPLARLREDLVATPYGDLEPDPVFPRTATDVIMLGDALAPEPVTHALVDLTIGPYREVLSVHGERRWERGPLGVGLRPSPPDPFTSTPLGWAQAFGGAALGPYGPIPSPDNPRGRGFYYSEDQARDGPLPSVEWHGLEVRAPLDRPEPAIVGPYPASWYLRLQRVWTVDPARHSVDLHPEAGMFDQAHPRLSGKPVRAGDRVVVQGAGPDLRTMIPPCPAAAEFRVGETRTPRPLDLEEVLIDTTRRVLVLAWRKCVQYAYVREQPRLAVLREARA